MSAQNYTKEINFVPPETLIYVKPATQHKMHHNILILLILISISGLRGQVPQCGE